MTSPLTSLHASWIGSCRAILFFDNSIDWEVLANEQLEVFFLVTLICVSRICLENPTA